MYLVLSSTQGSAPLKTADVAAMVNRRIQVGYGGVIVQHDSERKVRLRAERVYISNLAEISQSSESCPIARAPCVAYCGVLPTRPVLLDINVVYQAVPIHRSDCRVALLLYHICWTLLPGACCPSFHCLLSVLCSTARPC